MKAKAALFFYLLTAPVMAAEYQVGDFSGGLNTVISSHKLDPKYSPNLQNVFVHRKPGSIIRSNGFVTVGSTNVLKDGRYGFTAYAENGGKEFIVSDSSMALSTQDFRTYLFISSALTTTVGLDCAQVRNKVWCTNGVDPVFNWNLTTHVKQVLDGNSGLPNVPRGRYIETWQERVWILNTSADGSSLDYSSLITTAAEVLAPDDPRAWPSANRLEVGQGDGQVGTSLFVYNGRLFAGKEASTWITLGGPQTNYNMYKIEPQVGIVSNDSVAFLDGLVNWKGKSGIYKFDGTKAARITDGITPDMEIVNDSVGRILSNLWDTSTDFKRGILFTSTFTNNGVYNSTVTDTGFVQVIVGTFQATYFPANGPTDVKTLNSGTTFFRSPFITTVTVPYNFNGYFLKNRFRFQLAPGPGCACGDPSFDSISLQLTLKNEVNSSSYTVGYPFNSNCGIRDQTIVLSTGDLPVNGAVVNTSSFTYKWEIPNNPSCPNWSASVFPSTQADTYFTAYTTGQYISDVATLTSVTAWSLFDSVYQSNSGIVSFYYRTSTSVVNITTQTWVGITPGTNINAPTINNFVQWLSSFTADGTFANTPNVDNVTIGHIEGGANRDRPFAIEWNREYWLSIATGTNNASIQYVKAWGTHSNPDAWNRLQGQNIRSLFKDGNSTLYAGSASTGVFYRLDFGSNYDGQAIQSFYDTPDMTFGDVFNQKKLNEIWIDLDKSPGGTFDVGISTNGGVMGFKTFSIDGTGRKRKIVKGIGGHGSTYKLRFQNNNLDQNFGVHNVLIPYIETNVLDEN